MYRLIASVILMLIILQTDGCKSKDSPTSADNHSTPPVTEITEQERSDAFNGVEQMLSSVSSVSAEAGNQAIAAYLRTLPQIKSVGISDSTANVWALFKDNRVLIVANNRFPGGDTSLEMPKAQHRSIMDGQPPELPGAKQARLINAMGTGFVDPRPVLSGMLSSRGYAVTTAQGTVEDLMNVSGDGIFYIDTHGGKGINPLDTNKGGYSLWTATRRTSQLDSAYKEMFRLGELVYFTAKGDRARAV
ncbi:MAG: hypothetical protein HYR76_14365 [Ignavibacteria bacterium]|nr:hypothetical protein [Ignavibacteria bacterium]